jgi:uncharacterized protein YdaU (DUF1376 family)
VSPRKKTDSQSKGLHWYAWFPGAFLADTQDLDAQASGAYRALLDAQWMRGPLPTDTDELLRITKLPVRTWRNRARSVHVLCTLLTRYFVRFVHETGEGWVQERIERDRLQAIEKKATLHERAMLGATAAAKKRNLQGTLQGSDQGTLKRVPTPTHRENAVVERTVVTQEKVEGDPPFASGPAAADPPAAATPPGGSTAQDWKLEPPANARGKKGKPQAGARGKEVNGGSGINREAAANVRRVPAKATPAADRGPILFTFPCVGGRKNRGHSWPVYGEHFARWHFSFPDVDLDLEMRKITSWLASHPKKTFDGMEAFMHNWLNHAQNDSRGTAHAPNRAPAKSPGVQGIDTVREMLRRQSRN